MKRQEFIDFVRYLSARHVKKEEIIDTLKLLEQIYSKAALGETRDLKLANPKIKRYIVDPPGNCDFFLRISPFIREHRAGDMGLNEFVFKVIPTKSKEISQVLADSVSETLTHIQEALWFDELKISIKVRLPTGEELFGNFTKQETIGDIRKWINNRYNKDVIVIGAGWDPKITFDDDDISLFEVDLHQKRLILKMEGDLGRQKMEETERKKNLNLEQNKKEKNEKFLEQQQKREEKKVNEVFNHQRNVQRFHEDRLEAEERARRIIKQTTPLPTTSDVVVNTEDEKQKESNTEKTD